MSQGDGQSQGQSQGQGDCQSQRQSQGQKQYVVLQKAQALLMSTKKDEFKQGVELLQTISNEVPAKIRGMLIIGLVESLVKTNVRTEELERILVEGMAVCSSDRAMFRWFTLVHVRVLLDPGRVHERSSKFAMEIYKQGLQEVRTLEEPSLLCRYLLYYVLHISPNDCEDELTELEQCDNLSVSQLATILKLFAAVYNGSGPPSDALLVTDKIPYSEAMVLCAYAFMHLNSGELTKASQAVSQLISMGDNLNLTSIPSQVKLVLSRTESITLTWLSSQDIICMVCLLAGIIELLRRNRSKARAYLTSAASYTVPDSQLGVFTRFYQGLLDIVKNADLPIHQRTQHTSQAVSLPDGPLATYLLALKSQQQGDFDRAKLCYQQIFSLPRTNELHILALLNYSSMSPEALEHLPLAMSPVHKSVETIVKLVHGLGGDLSSVSVQDYPQLRVLAAILAAKYNQGDPSRLLELVNEAYTECKSVEWAIMLGKERERLLRSCQRYLDAETQASRNAQLQTTLQT